MKNFLSVRFCLTALLLVMLTQAISAQQTRRRFQADYDAKPVKFGYFLGMTNTHFNVKFNNYFVNKDNYFAITSPPTWGLKMGGLANFRINDYFDFRVLPTVAIYGRRLEYRFINTSPDVAEKDKFGIKNELRETAWFEIPLMFKYKSERRGNVRMYVFGGMRYGIETNAVNRKNRKQFTTKSNDFSIEYGTGIEFFREYFKFAPELHFSHGLVNLIDPVNAKGTAIAGIDKMTTHTVTLFLLFE